VEAMSLCAREVAQTTPLSNVMGFSELDRARKNYGKQTL